MTASRTATATPLDPGAGLTERIIRLGDGRRIRTIVAGRGPGPLVVFEAGMSAPAAEWLAVQRAVSAHARTLSYDRSGYGGSDDDPQPRTLARMAGDLGAVLDAVGEKGPVVLVGHSWGGPIIRAFVHDHPGRVAGIVLVDASLAGSSATRTQVTLGAASFRVTGLLVRLGLGAKVIRQVLPHGFAPEFSEEDAAIATRDYASVRAMRTGVREMKEVMGDKLALEEWEREGLPDVPVVALQGGRVENSAAGRRFRDDFNQEAARVLAGHPRATVRTVPNAGHLIPQERPSAVTAAITEVLAAG